MIRCNLKCPAVRRPPSKFRITQHPHISYVYFFERQGKAMNMIQNIKT